jgi:trehalose 6-phosphate phosphatase
LGIRYPENAFELAESERLAQAKRLWLFLDYDGTLADFAPTPDDILPDSELLKLLADLSNHPNIRVAIISGRRLDHIKALVPLPGVLLSGTYGIEIQTFNAQTLNQIEFESVRPALEAFKPRWENLIAGREGFYLEDKGWTLAIHARVAEDDEAEQVIADAVQMADEDDRLKSFKLLGGHKFIEISPHLASKGKAVEYLLDRYRWAGALPVFIGDDDKDEEAFQVVRSVGGITIVVTPTPRSTSAQYCLENTREVRRWLAWILTHF